MFSQTLVTLSALDKSRVWVTWGVVLAIFSVVSDNTGITLRRGGSLAVLSSERSLGTERNSGVRYDTQAHTRVSLIQSFSH